MTLPDAVFGAALVAYFLGSVVFLANLFLKHARLNSIGTAIAMVGALFHTSSIILRGAEARSLPLSSPGEEWSFLAWAMVSLYLSLALRPRMRFMGAFVLPATFTSVLVAALSSDRRPILAGISHWGLALHVTASILSIGAFALAFGCAVCYLIQDSWLKQKRPLGLMRSLPSLDVLDTTSYWLIVLGFCLLTMGLVTGALLIHGAWSAALSPETFATLLLWLTYGVYLYVRGVTRWRGRRTHTIVVAAVLALLILYGVVVLLVHPSTLHNGALVSEVPPDRVGATFPGVGIPPINPEVSGGSH